MKIINTNDIIFARATMMGREILNLRFSGITSMEDLLRRVRQQLGNLIGMINVSIRNISQGWCQSTAYMLR